MVCKAELPLRLATSVRPGCAYPYIQIQLDLFPLPLAAIEKCFIAPTK